MGQYFPVYKELWLSFGSKESHQRKEPPPRVPHMGDTNRGALLCGFFKGWPNKLSPLRGWPVFCCLRYRAMQRGSLCAARCLQGRGNFFMSQCKIYIYKLSSIYIEVTKILPIFAMKI